LVVVAIFFMLWCSRRSFVCCIAIFHDDLQQLVCVVSVVCRAVGAGCCTVGREANVALGADKVWRGGIESRMRSRDAFDPLSCARGDGAGLPFF
jgi:hypothetical protein